jgi:hypothetical protein
MPDTYTFDGNLTTIIGLFGLIFTLYVVVFAYRRYWNSPYRK